MLNPKNLCFSLALFIISQTIHAMTIQDFHKTEIYAGYVKHVETLADHDDANRLGFELGMNFQKVPIFSDLQNDYIKYSISARFLPDNSKGTKEVNINRNQMYFGGSVVVVYPYFFLFKLGLRESLITEFINYKIADKTESENDFQLSSAIFTGFDYQIIEHFIFNFMVEYEFKHKDDQFSYSTMSGISYRL